MSHLATHRKFLGDIRRVLAGRGISAFVAHSTVNPSAEWEATMEQALRSCHAMAVFLHDGFHESNWCDQEVGFAIARRIPLAPIVVGDLMPYGFVGRFQAVFARNLSATGIARKIWDWLMVIPSLEPLVVEGVVSGLEIASSIGGTRELISTLKRIEYLTHTQLERLERVAAFIGVEPVSDIVRDVVTWHKSF